MPIRVGMVSLGCPKNQVDAEIMLASLNNDEFEICNQPEICDVIIINTCGFIESAKAESIENILEFAALKEEGAVKAIVVTGCLAERYRDEVAKELPEVDAVVGIGCNSDIADIIRSVVKGKRFTRFGEKTALPLNGERVLTTPNFYAYLKIADGCDNCCSYCAIPKIRGRYRSRKMEDIIGEARALAAQGVKELVIVAQDTTRYGVDIYNKLALPELLVKLCEVDGIEWIRVLYCYPERISDELLDVMAFEPKILPYLDLPIQHVSDNILKAMNRSGSKKELLTLIDKIRKKIPDIILRTTLIAGFPGESEQDFEELVEFVKEMRFSRLGCFTYSAEEGTPAAAMENQVDPEVARRRCEIIMREQSFIMEQLARDQVGKVLRVLTEGYDDKSKSYFGRSTADAPEIDGRVFFVSEGKKNAGDFVMVKITDNIDFDLYGEAID